MAAMNEKPPRRARAKRGKRAETDDRVEYDKFDTLTKPLVSVPKKEIDQARARQRARDRAG